jgi:hypothetical protein
MDVEFQTFKLDHSLSKLVLESTTVWKVQMKSKPFDRGSFRIAYYMKSNTGMFNICFLVNNRKEQNWLQKLLYQAKVRKKQLNLLWKILIVALYQSILLNYLTQKNQRKLFASLLSG